MVKFLAALPSGMVKGVVATMKLAACAPLNIALLTVKVAVPVSLITNAVLMVVLIAVVPILMTLFVMGLES